MKHLRVGIWAVLAAFGWVAVAPAQTPDDRYLAVYSMIEQADRMKTAGETRAAQNRYLEAQVALKELQQTYPDWNVRIVGFRLDYIASQLAPLTKGGVPSQPNPAEAGKVNPQEQMQNEIARLAGQNAFLEAKLREALKVQPASSDPRELARAEERIKALQKERDLLAITLEQLRGAPSTETVGSTGAPAQAEVDPIQAVTQSAILDVLKQQNGEMERRIVELQGRLQNQAVGDRSETLPLKEAIAALEASNRVMKAEQIAMENRLLELVKTYSVGASDQDKQYEKKLAEARASAETAQRERDALTQRLDAVTKELTKSQDRPATPASVERERQFESIRARLEVFEAKAVPYSDEELALFKHPPAKLAAAQTAAPAPTNAPAPASAPPPAPAVTPNANPPPTASAAPSANTTNTAPVTTRRKELPAGAGPLLRDADRAIDAGRFEEAESKLRDLLRQDSEQPFVLAKLAAVQMDQDKTAEAEASLKQALAIDPQDPASLYLMGNLKVRQEKFNEGIDLLSQTVKITPDNAQAHFFLAKALIQTGQRKPAETALRRAIHLKPAWGEAHYLMAVIYATEEPNFRGLAQYHYKRAIAGGTPRNPELERYMEKNAAASAGK